MNRTQNLSVRWQLCKPLDHHYDSRGSNGQFGINGGHQQQKQGRRNQLLLKIEQNVDQLKRSFLPTERFWGPAAANRFFSSPSEARSKIKKRSRTEFFSSSLSSQEFLLLLLLLPSQLHSFLLQSITSCFCCIN